MATFTFTTEWNGTSIVGTNIYQNHDSKLTKAEVTGLVKDLDKLSGFGDGGGWSVSRPKGMPDKIWALAQGLRNTKATVMIDKGIHQRATDPHIRIILATGAAHYHVELSAEGTKGGAFNWKTVGVTFITKHSHQYERWPNPVVRTLPSAPGLTRRGSISIGNSGLTSTVTPVATP